MDQFKALRAFTTVAKEGSFVGASRKLATSAPSVTRLVSELEAYLQTKLLHRSTRSVRLTEAGVAYLDDANKILAALAAADDAAAGAQYRPQGTLRITASVMFGQIYVMPVIGEYLKLYPDVTVEALFVDRVVNILDEGIDLAIRIGELSSSSLIAATVGRVSWMVCGSPSYLEASGTIAVPEDLINQSIIGYGAANPKEWSFADNQRVILQPRICFSTVTGTIAAAKLGLGLTRALSYQIAPDLNAGDLRTVLSEHERDPVPIHVVHAEGPLGAAKTRAFKELIIERLRSNQYLNRKDSAEG
ncbi:MAG: LysR family transcriptional regulator [Pseudomonadota bacterium]